MDQVPHTSKPSVRHRFLLNLVKRNSFEFESSNYTTWAATRLAVQKSNPNRRYSLSKTGKKFRYLLTCTK